MKTLKSLSLLLMIACSNLLFSQVAQPDYTQYVNPFVGTGGHGHTYPGASLPFGMVQLSPDTRLTGWDGCSGYHYSDSIVYGFSHTHLSGTGCSDYGDILLMPFSGEAKFKNTEYASPFKHAKEIAKAGYYSVYLEKGDINAELTATLRTGFHRYTFMGTEPSGIIIDLKHRDEVLESSIEVVGDKEVRGMRRSKAWAEDQTIFFVARFSKPFQSFSICDQDVIKKEVRKANSKSLQVALQFPAKGQEIILVKVGISAVSIEGALKNLEAEQRGWDFDATVTAAKTAWNKELSRIEVESPDTRDLKTFYSALYHCMLTPNLYMDVDHQYRGRDNKIHKADSFDYYTVFSLWDTYRAEHPLFSLIDRKRTADFINTFIAQYEQGGLLPVWELSANETFCMIGYHAVPVIADAMLKNLPGFDEEKAFKACVNSAKFDRAGLGLYIKNGYVPGDLEHESVSKTLEYAYDDWCIALMALKLKKMDDFDYFIRRAQSYKNIFDPSTWFMRPRVNGGWYSPFEPGEVNNHFTEANAWQYSLYVPQDLTNLVKYMHGKENFSSRLDELFSTSDSLSGRQQADISGLIGQYAHGNEPSHHMAYLYDFVGEPWKTQKLVNKILTEFYSPEPDGLIGNEDCGQMSAWYVLSSLGIYEVCPADNQWYMSAPHFPKATIHLENGKTFVINAPTKNPQNYYIQSAILNDEDYSRNFLFNVYINDGGVLNVELGPVPNKAWGTNTYTVPRSEIRMSHIVPAPFILATSRSFSDTLQISMGCLEPADIYFTIDGSEPDSSKTKFKKPFVISKTTTIKLIAYIKGQGQSVNVEGHYSKTVAGLSVKLNTAYENQYTAGGPNALIDGLRGSTNWRVGNWQGYQKNDMDAVIDMGSKRKVSKISVGFLQDTRAWIVFPKEVEFLVSDDGKEFISIGIVKSRVDVSDINAQLQEYSVKCDKKVRYLEVKAKNFGKLPEWHESPGGDAHLFVDEITVE